MTCSLEYDKSADNKECIAKVTYCKEMVAGSIDLCDTCYSEY